MLRFVSEFVDGFDTLAEIGPAAKDAVPRLKKMMDEEINDEIAASAKRAVRRIQPEALSGE